VAHRLPDVIDHCFCSPRAPGRGRRARGAPAIRRADLLRLEIRDLVAEIGQRRGSVDAGFFSLLQPAFLEDLELDFKIGEERG